MQTEIFNNIDTLIEMSGVTSNIDELNAELISLRRQIRNKKSEIEDLKSMINDARYFNASNELVDKNIEISLKNKITRLNRKLKNIEQENQEISNNEKKLHDEINSLKQRVKKNQEYLQILEQKEAEENIASYYKDLLAKEKSSNAILENDLAKKEEEYQEVLKDLELHSEAKKELTDNLSKEKERLNDTLDSLNNPNTYLDLDLKQNDEEKLKRLQEELKQFEQREIEILNDANLVGMDAKELLANNSYDEALNKIKELVNIVKQRPYMDINNLAILDEELEKKEAKRTQLSNLIDSKNYEGMDSDTINVRIKYLDSEINKSEEVIAKTENECHDIDDFISNTLSNRISELESEIAKDNERIESYYDLLNDKNRNAKTKASIEQVITKKEKELALLNDILMSYKEELIAKINETNDLNKIAKSFQERIKKMSIEREKLEKTTLVNFKTKDLIEEEHDKDELKKLNEEIKALKNRQKYQKTPSEIYDEVEMLLASFTPKKEQAKPKTLEIDSLFTKPEEDSKKIKVIEMIPVETVTKGGASS